MKLIKLCKTVYDFLSYTIFKSGKLKGFAGAIKDDQVTQYLMPGFDEGQLVLIALTNSHLYVIGECGIIHEIKKTDIRGMNYINGFKFKFLKGMSTKLIEVGCESDLVYFKVLGVKSLGKLTEWL